MKCQYFQVDSGARNQNTLKNQYELKKIKHTLNIPVNYHRRLRREFSYLAAQNKVPNKIEGAL